MLVEADDAELVRCAVRGRRLRPVCGDRVAWERVDDEGGVVSDIVARTRTLERADGRGGTSPIASHLDRVFVVVAPQPEPEPALVDRYLVMVERGGIDGAILVNKADLADADFLERFDGFRRAGYPVIVTSARLREGLETLTSELAGRTTMLVGQSGVGKSSLLNALIPDLALQTSRLTTGSGEGRHTTTATTRYALPGGGALVDSPGVREFWLPQMPARELIAGFREIARHGADCRFRDCVHGGEPGCAVVAAVEAGDIDERRYRSYRQLARTIT